MQKFFITATGTGIGKTFVTCALTQQLRARGKNVRTIKPVISGYDASDEHSDTALIAKASGQSIQSISPWRFAAALSPDMAASLENKKLELSEIIDFCKAQTADIVLIEGVGGVMVPLNDTHTTLDWMQKLAYPVILVGGTYLGAISHVLSAIETLNSRNIKLQALVISESENSTVTLAQTLATLNNFIPKDVHITAIPRNHLPDISEIIL